MTETLRRISLLTLVAGVTATARAAEPTTRQFGGENQPALTLAVPDGWIATTVAGSRRGAVSVRLNAREPAGPSAMNLMFKADPPGRPTDDARLRDLISEAARAFLDDSIEKRAELKPLGDGVDGYSVTLTDTNPGTSKRSYACATVIGRRLGDGVLLANVLHPKASAQLPRAIDLFRTAALPAPPTSQPAPAGTQPAGELRVVSSDNAWAVVLNWPGLPAGAKPRRWPTTRRADGTIVYAASRPAADTARAAGDPVYSSARIDVTADDGTQIMISIDPAPVPGDARAARDYLAEHRLKNESAVRKMTLAGTRDLGLITFTTGGPNRSAVATLVRDGRWVVVNLSHPMATDADLRGMTQALKAIRIEPISPSASQPSPAATP